MWIRYTYNEAAANMPPLKKPRKGEDSLQMLDRLGLNQFPDETLEAAGFKGYDSGELFYSCLASPWRGHPKHARFISDNIGEGFAFAVEMTESQHVRAGRKGGRIGGLAKSEKKLKAVTHNLTKRYIPPSPDLLNGQQAADLAGVSRNWIAKLHKRGELPHAKGTKFFKKSDVEKFARK